MSLQLISIAERFMYIITTRFEGNKRKFSQSIGYTPTIISKITTNKTKPSFDVLQAVLLTNKDINADWLLTGSGRFFQKDANIKLKKITNYKEAYIKLLEENRRLLSDSMFFQKKIFSAKTKHLAIDYQPYCNNYKPNTYRNNKESK